MAKLQERVAPRVEQVPEKRPFGWRWIAAAVAVTLASMIVGLVVFTPADEEAPSSVTVPGNDAVAESADPMFHVRQLVEAGVLPAEELTDSPGILVTKPAVDPMAHTRALVEAGVLPADELIDPLSAARRMVAAGVLPADELPPIRVEEPSPDPMAHVRKLFEAGLLPASEFEQPNQAE